MNNERFIVPEILFNLSNLPLLSPCSYILFISRMNNERFMVPEILFNPSDIGIRQMGIPEVSATVSEFGSVFSIVTYVVLLTLILLGQKQKNPTIYSNEL